MRNSKYYTVGQFAKLVHKSVRTVQRWDLKGVLRAHRTITNRRYYTHRQANQVLGITPSNNERNDHKVYAL